MRYCLLGLVLLVAYVWAQDNATTAAPEAATAAPPTPKPAHGAISSFGQALVTLGSGILGAFGEMCSAAYGMFTGNIFR